MERRREEERKEDERLVTPPVLTLLDGQITFIIYIGSFHKRLGCVLRQNDEVMADTSRQGKTYEQKYSMYDRSQ